VGVQACLQPKLLLGIGASLLLGVNRGRGSQWHQLQVLLPGV